MATFVLIHGAGSDAWYWHRVIPELQARGHDVVAPDMPCDDDTASLTEYADAVNRAIGERRDDLLVVAQSLGGFIAPLVCQERGVRLLALVAAMVPRPGESAGDWWTNTGWEEARRVQLERDGRWGKFDPMADFFHDVPADVVAQAFARGERAQSGTPFGQPWPLQGWPDVPTKFLLCRQDRFFPAEFMRRVVRERLDITPDEIDSGHLPALSHPLELVAWLETCRLSLA